MDEKRRNLVQGIGLACVAGYVDTLGFVALFGLFTAHVTGNFVLIGAGLAGTGQGSIALKLLAFPAFVAGVAAARLLLVACERRQWPALSLAFLLQLLLLCAFMVCSELASPIGGATTPLAMAGGLFGAGAMGAHSATSRLLLAQLAPTSMMTGNVTQLVIDGVDCLRGVADGTVGARLVKFIWPLLAFGGGAILAAFAYRALGFSALLLPIGILCALMVLAWKAQPHLAEAP
jgi:uncharacterized membrane protein YoaK (UPF0700 family)